MTIVFLFLVNSIIAQTNLTPELLWKMGRVSGKSLSADKQTVYYTVSFPDVEKNKSQSKTYKIPIQKGEAQEVINADSILNKDRISPDGKYIISTRPVKLKKVYGKDFYPDLPTSNVQIYESLNYRHWDTWFDGTFNHVFVAPLVNGTPGEAMDIMLDEPYDCPQKPFGGHEDFIWSPDSKKIIYVSKKEIRNRLCHQYQYGSV